MGRTAGRDPDETRRVILDTAMTLIAARGVGISLAEIARTAGVSKGGLLYHFPTKDDLLEAGAAALIAAFRAQVRGFAASEPDGTPGRLSRAYIRASFAELSSDGLREQIAVAAQVMTTGPVARLTAEDARRWREELMSDGLPAETVRIVVAATDGVSSAPLWGAILNADDLRALEDSLVAMTRRADVGPAAAGGR